MKIESHTNKDFTVEDLLTRGWTRTLMERFLKPENYRDSVDHFRNYAGKKMFQRRRVELTETSAEFEAAFILSAKRRRLAPERIDATCTRIRELRESRQQPSTGGDTRPDAARNYRRIIGESGIQTWDAGRRTGVRGEPTGREHPLQQLFDQLREANIRVLSREEIVFREIAELLEQARARGYRTPHK
jgi:hypothetical protein